MRKRVYCTRISTYNTPMEQSSHWEVLADAVRLIHSSLDLDKTLQTIMESISKVVGAEAGSLVLLDKDCESLFFKTSTGARSQELKKIKIPFDRGIVGWVAKHGQSVLVEDALADPRHDRAFAEKIQFMVRSVLAVPILDERRTIGVIEVLNSLEKKSFDQDDRRFLEILAPHVANALKNAKAYGILAQTTEDLRRAQAMRQAIIGKNPDIRHAIELVQKIAPFDTTVLITGESGTGKELFARAVHENSNRVDGPFVAVNCTAMPEALLESELFGHEKGSFTGALATRLGKFELANKGTLFLDEIGDMSASAQAKVLRAIEEKVFARVGGSRDIEVNTRIVCATNRDLKKEVQDKRFREDLYYRINEFLIVLPPLRTRKEDLPELVDNFIREFARQFSKKVNAISKEALQLLLSYDWPGNVRQLRNVLKSSVIMASGSIIQLDHLPNEIRLKDAKAYISHGAAASLDQLERGYVLSVLTDTRWNKSQAAKILKISRPTLDKKIKDFDLHQEKS